MIRTGKVIKADGDTLSVCFERPEMCQHCGACGHKQESLVKIKGQAQAGDRVLVDMPEAQLLRTSLFTYLVPILSLLLGLLIGSRITDSEQGAALCGLVGLILSLAFVILYDRYLGKHRHTIPQIIAVEKFEEE